jgi:hypothetical protein
MAEESDQIFKKVNIRCRYISFRCRYIRAYWNYARPSKRYFWCLNWCQFITRRFWFTWGLVAILMQIKKDFYVVIVRLQTTGSAVLMEKRSCIQNNGQHAKNNWWNEYQRTKQINFNTKNNMLTALNKIESAFTKNPLVEYDQYYNE